MSQIKLVKTCNACPEQYEAFLDGKQVGYLRLRWGSFSVEYPDVGGELVYYTTLGSGISGVFPDEHSRVKHLNAACRVILAAISKREDEQPIYTMEVSDG